MKYIVTALFALALATPTLACDGEGYSKKSDKEKDSTYVASVLTSEAPQKARTSSKDSEDAN